MRTRFFFFKSSDASPSVFVVQAQSCILRATHRRLGVTLPLLEPLLQTTTLHPRHQKKIDGWPPSRRQSIPYDGRVPVQSHHADDGRTKCRSQWLGRSQARACASLTLLSCGVHITRIVFVMRNLCAEHGTYVRTYADATREKNDRCMRCTLYLT